MAGRKAKFTVDYFPHDATHGKTIFILEEQFGNDGYAFWFKLLELLGSSENHVYDIRDEQSLDFLYAKCKVNNETGDEILKKIVKLNGIDVDMFERGLLWSFNFTFNLKELYRKRKKELPGKDALIRINGAEIPICSAGNTQTILNQIKLNQKAASLNIEPCDPEVGKRDRSADDYNLIIPDKTEKPKPGTKYRRGK